MAGTKNTAEEVQTPIQLAAEYGYTIIGASLVALAFNLFLLPNSIASGGVSGISILTDALLGWEPALVQWGLNIPIFIAGVVLLGKRFGVKTLVGTVFLPFIVYLTRNITPATTDPLLGALFGGIVVGLGLGIVFRGKSSTGGTDVVAQIIHKYTGVSLGKCIALIDGLIVFTAALVFDIERGLYAIVSLYVISKTIDLVQVGMGTSKMAMIITNKEDEVRQQIFKIIDRGVTKISGFGGYTDRKQPILMCVVQQREFTKLKQLVESIDASAFIVVMDASEVVGEGFKKI